MDRKEKQNVVRIDSDLFNELEDFLDTPEAKEAGFHSKAPFLNDAVRKALEKYKKKRFEHFNFAENVIRLIDNDQPKGNPYIEIALNNSDLVCRVCESKNCIHITEAWKSKDIAKQLRRKNLKKPS